MNNCNKKTGNGGCQECSVGKYQNAINHQITACKFCDKGKHQNMTGQSQCLNCGSEHLHSDIQGSVMCSVCGKGSFTSGGTSSETRTDCNTCLLGHYCDGNGLQASCAQEGCSP